MLFANKGEHWGRTIRGIGDLAIVYERPPIHTKAIFDWYKEIGILPRLNSVHVIYPDDTDKKKIPLRQLREGWERVLWELEYQEVRRALVMGTDDVIGLIAPKLRGSVDEKDVGLRLAHGTIFKRDNIEFVPTWQRFQSHMAGWWERDIDRFINLKRPEKPLEYHTSVPANIKRPPFMVIDLETTGLDSYSDKITTLGLQWSDTERAIIQEPGSIEHMLWVLNGIAKKGTRFIFHNGQFDLGFMGAQFREAAYGLIHDTMIRSKSSGELMNSLKHLGNLYTNRPGNYAWYDGDNERSFDDPAYVCEDLEVTWQLAKKYGIIA